MESKVVEQYKIGDIECMIRECYVGDSAAAIMTSGFSQTRWYCGYIALPEDMTDNHSYDRFQPYNDDSCPRFSQEFTWCGALGEDDLTIWLGWDYAHYHHIEHPASLDDVRSHIFEAVQFLESYRKAGLK